MTGESVGALLAGMFELVSSLAAGAVADAWSSVSPGMLQLQHHPWLAFSDERHKDRQEGRRAWRSDG